MKKILFIFILLWGAILLSAQNRTFNLNEGQTNFTNKSLQIYNPELEKNAIQYRELDLNHLLQSQGLIHANDTIILDLFEKKNYKACVEKTAIDINNSYTIVARIIDKEFGYCFISTCNGKSFITIDVPEKNEFYKTKYNHQTQQYRLIEIDKSKEIELEESPSLIPPKLNIPHKVKPKSSILNSNEKVQNKTEGLLSVYTQDTVSLLIVYTPAATVWSAANETDINNTISLLMTRSQLALDNSNTMLTLELVHSAEVDYVEQHGTIDLYNLTYANDDQMDTVHYLRNTHKADVVVLLEETDYTRGQGWLYDDSPMWGFSLTRVQQAGGTFTTIHEIGHNMGCHHHKEQNFQEGPGWFTYSAGWRWTDNYNTKYCSVMTYESGTYFDDGISHTRVPYFSSPLIQYQDVYTGDANDADNARTIRELKGAIAAFRSTPANLTITDITYKVGDDECFGATDTIKVSGDGNNVIFESGTTGNFTAGKSIIFSHGFHAQSGSNISAYIDLSNTFCEPAPASFMYAQNYTDSYELKPQLLKKVDHSESNELIIYPNPNNGQFKVELSNFDESAKLQITNSLGAIVHKKNISNGISDFNLKHLNRGLYFISVKSGNSVENDKILIQ